MGLVSRRQQGVDVHKQVQRYLREAGPGGGSGCLPLRLKVVERLLTYAFRDGAPFLRWQITTTYTWVCTSGVSFPQNMLVG